MKLLSIWLAGTLFCGCYQHSYHERSPIAANNFVAIDEQVPIETTQWSYLWGLLNEAPLSPPAAECDGRGAGKLTVTTPWFGAPVTLLSLGAASPAIVTLYCNTDPGDVPEGP